MMLEALKMGNNEAEWIVDLTTQADRQGRCQATPCVCVRRLVHVPPRHPDESVLVHLATQLASNLEP